MFTITCSVLKIEQCVNELNIETVRGTERGRIKGREQEKKRGIKKEKDKKSAPSKQQMCSKQNRGKQRCNYCRKEENKDAHVQAQTV